MNTQAILPFAPSRLAPKRRAALDFAALGRQRRLGVETLAIPRNAAGEVRPLQFERELERIFRRAVANRRAVMVEIGDLSTEAEPYPEAERSTGGLRAVLEGLTDWEGLTLTLTTRSPLALRDVDLLERLDHVHSVTARVPLPAVDPDLAWLLEGPQPLPQARLRLVERLAAAGIATEVVCLPIFPGVNDDEPLLAALLGCARKAHARDVIPGLFTLRPTARPAFLRWLGQELPHLMGRCRRLYSLRGEISAAETERLLARFRALRLEHGFPRPTPGRG